MMFEKFANFVSKAAGSKWTSLAAFLIVIVWAAFGPYTNYSTQWSLLINTLTTILTFCMVFIIQNSQNRNDAAIHIKLDEIIKGVDNARNEFAGIEEKTEKEILEMKKECQKD
jgi:low affinity Fe/Cu permease